MLLSNWLNTGCTARTVNGKLTKTSAIAMPIGVKAILIPNRANHCPNKPLGAYKFANTIPATAVGSAKGRSIKAFKIDFPLKS